MKISTALPLKKTSARLSITVPSLFIKMTLVPFCLAIPTIKKQSHSLQAFIAPSNTPNGNDSPNKTTLGLIKPETFVYS